jgi:hypothetical protein
MQCHDKPRVYHCFLQFPEHVGAVSLNRSEQILYDYMQGQRDERQYWQSKVQSFVRESAEVSAAVDRLDSELWRYYLDRSEVVPALVAAARAHGLKRTSMKNLAEYLVRIWAPPLASKRKSPPESGMMS